MVVWWYMGNERGTSTMVFVPEHLQWCSYMGRLAEMIHQEEKQASREQKEKTTSKLLSLNTCAPVC
eukprot:864928-Amorphochlora_amoeboformis.AAC.1